MFHETRIGLMRVIPNLMQRNQLIRKAVRRLRFRKVQTVLLLEAERVVDVRPVGRQLMMVEIQMAGHRVDGSESRIAGTFRDRGVVRIGEVGIGSARRRGRVLAQLLPDDDQIVVLLEDLARNVVGVVVHILGTVWTHLGPVGVVQAAVVQTCKEERRYCSGKIIK